MLSVAIRIGVLGLFERPVKSPVDRLLEPVSALEENIAVIPEPLGRCDDLLRLRFMVRCKTNQSSEISPVSPIFPHGTRILSSVDEEG